MSQAPAPPHLNGGPPVPVNLHPQHQSDGTVGIGNGPDAFNASGAPEVLCGPLLNYKHTSNATSGAPIWHGSVLVVLSPGTPVQPDLALRCLGSVNQSQAVNGVSSDPRPRVFQGTKLYEDPKKAFWRFVIDLPFQSYEARWEYTLNNLPSVGANQFCVPSVNQSMRIMFHSCNGFSVGTDIDAWSGPALWNDVLRMHNQKPFHVMIGGGDQIYNDGVRVDGPLRPWTDISNPKKRREFPFPESLRKECDDYYFKNYISWYGTKPFAVANGQIPQLNIWDDHDIIDGFGSYTDHFMRCSVFRGIGGVAHKYYLLFQHHIAPPKSTFTTDAPHTMHHDGVNGTPPDAEQLKDTYVMVETEEDPSYIIGQQHGPYVEEKSRSIFCQLGARIAFVGVDARIERTRHQINYPETYDLIFNKISAELSVNKNIRHLILLLGVPIAYPRLQWLENIFSSPLIAPLRLLNKRFGFAGGFFNKFDGQVDLLDDLDDHYTAHQHKAERRDLIHRLQNISKQHNVRISILGGDVHLAAIGRFYSKQHLGIPAEKDWRYMPNIISSAITNKPPPQAVANLLAKRNKIHHLDHETDETLLEIFDHDPGRVPGQQQENGEKANKKTSDGNHATMPSRNYAIISESHEPSQIGNGNNGYLAPGSTPGANREPSIAPTETSQPDPKANPRHPIHLGEQNAGTQHPAATGLRYTNLCGEYGLDVTLRVEISNKDREGKTEGYGFSIPGLEVAA